MNKNAVKLINAYQDGHIDKIDRLFNREYQYDYPSTLGDWPKNPLKVRKKERKMEVYCLARHSFWFYLTEIHRCGCLQKPTYFSVDMNVLRAAWCMINNINFATDKLSDAQAMQLRNAYSFWISYRQHTNIMTVYPDRNAKTWSHDRQRDSTEMRPKWLDSGYMSNDLRVVAPREADVAANVGKGFSMNVLFLLGEESKYEFNIHHGVQAARMAVMAYAIKNDEAYFTSLMGKGRLETAKKMFAATIPFDDRWLETRHDFVNTISRNNVLCVTW